MNEQTMKQLDALGTHLRARREVILQEWRKAAEADPTQTTVSVLTRAQFNDHIPPLLDAFENKLRARPGSDRAASAEQTTKQEEVKHGLQRWQQGYKLAELMQEWGHLHLCLSKEMGAFAAARRDIESETWDAAHSALIGLINEGIKKSVGEYARLQQAEAAGHVRDLKQALANVSEIEQRRAVLIRQAVHDLRGNVQSVSTAADVLGETNMGEVERIEFAKLIQQGVEVVSGMLGELMTLARLEAGQEKRQVTRFDAAKVLAELCTTNQPFATARNLFLKMEGPPALLVEGDATKVRRLVQNLLFNALKYTEEGGVTMLWGEEKGSWWVTVKDTGPGMMAGPSAPIAAGLKEATASARETDAKASDDSQESSHVLQAAPGDSKTAPQSRVQPAGEGIGLSIVKRLCELLDASVEFASSPETGSTFRVLFPRSYQATQNKPKSVTPEAV
jgi:signal transduction histidine kinase